MSSHELKTGDPVWYRHQTRGGYGFEVDVPAVYLRATTRRLRVRVFTKAGTTADISVLPAHVRPRDPQEVWK
jgi:hypothetical protein